MPSEHSRFVDNHGVRVHYLDTGGDATDAPVVFVPGMSDLAADYIPILDSFGRRCVVIDLRGHGPSHSPATGYSLEDQVSDINTVVNAVTTGPVHLMTFSRGTCYALAWAARAPRRVLSISIGDYPAREIDLPPEAAENFITGRWRGTPVMDRVSEPAARGIFAEAVERPLWDDLAGLDVPVLVVRGTARVPLTDEDWSRYADVIPEAELVEFADSPHDIFRPDRQRYPLLVRAHIERSEAAAQ